MEIKHIKSTEGNCWQEGTVGSEKFDDILELTGKEKQKILGFGGCFNELGWEAVQKLSEEDRNNYLDELFSEDKCNFNFGRVPIGANDFSLIWYSCDETDGDYELKEFNIERDKEFTIPFIKEAQKRRNDNIQVFGSPWSPPTWMKTKKVYNFGTLRMEPEVLKAYAKYFVKFVEAYAKEGVQVTQVHVQNEPMADQKFPSCKWKGEDMLVFIRDYLGPEIKASGLNTELWLGTINGPFIDIMLSNQSDFSEFWDQFVNTILSDKMAREYIAGVGIQWGGKHILEQIETAYPEMRMMQTEQECGDGNNTWEYMEYCFGMMLQYFRHGTERYLYWNMALQEGGISTWGWKQNSLITVHPQTNKITYQPEFYLMKHFSSFIKPGAVYLEGKGNMNANSVAFKNTDGSIVIVVGSNMSRARQFTFTNGDITFSAAIEPHSIHTFIVS